MIAELGLREAVRELSARRSVAVADVEHALTALEKTLKRLEGALMETRLLPISAVFGRFSLLVREVSHGDHKRVRLITAGGQTQLDKTVLDRLGEPLVHLVTNGIIHGVESPAERKKAGKPEEAVISLSATQRSDWVVVTVSDDGRGLDPEKILAKARTLGAAPAGTTPSLEETYALAFLPGLSTTDEVSALAGRGVGLDVVANSIRSLGGSIEVASEPGRGTTFTLHLPLTLAVLRSLLVAVDGERYALPLGDVAESLKVPAEAIHEIEGRGMMLWRGHVIPVSDAGSILGTANGASHRRYCVVIRSGGKRRGMLVDGLLGHQDVVVKALDPTLGRPPAISGATILGDGRVACILDTARFAEPRAVDPRAAALSA
jgi:two-component system chemotaxis sensor kinase CheA